MFTQKMSLFTSLLLTVLLGSSLVLGLVLLHSSEFLQKKMFTVQEKKFNTLTQTAVDEIEQYLSAIEETLNQNIRIFQRMDSNDKESVLTLLRETLETHPSLTSTTLIYTEKNIKKNPDRNYSQLYVWIDRDGKIVAEDFIDELYDDYATDWFQEPFQKKKALWTDPYFENYINALMVTYAVPVLNKDGEVDAIFTVDITLDWLGKFLRKTGEPLIVSSKQELIFHPWETWILQKTLPELAKEEIDPQNRDTYSSLSKAFQENSFGNIHLKRPITNENVWYFYSRIPKLGWTLSFLLPEAEVIGPLNQIQKTIVRDGLFGLILLIPIFFLIIRSAILPISRLGAASREIARGNFDTDLPKTTGANREIVELVQSFDIMKTDLKRYISDLTETTKAKEKITAQLNVARNIQLGMVPHNFSLLQDHQIDLHAILAPAQEVGGDLYDFAVLDPDRFYFCIGDVSGKGVPASLFMAVGKTLIRSTILATQDPALALKMTSQELMKNNENGLFITGMCGIFDRKTNQILCSNAGHCQPIRIDPKGKAEYINLATALPLAIMEEIEYKNELIDFPTGNTLFLYSDGVTDAENVEGKMIGTEGLLKKLNGARPDKAKSFVETMLAWIRTFATGAKQSDDITIFSFINRDNP